MTGLPIAQAARAMGERPGTVRRWVREGCPVTRRGARGRGRATELDPDEVRRWRQADAREAVVLELAGHLPEMLAVATAESWRLATGIDKRRLAGVLCALWYLCSTAILDRLREQCPSVPDLTRLPERIEALQKIARE